MRILLLTCILIIISGFHLNGQNLFLEAKSGYGANYVKGRDNYTSPVDYIPVQFSLGGGLKNLQLGCDFIFNPQTPSYFYFDEFTDNKRLREETHETYIGGFLRLNTSKNPEKNAGYILKVGLGQLQSEKVIYNLPSDNKHESSKYESSLQYLGETGVNIPIMRRLHVYLGVGIRHAKMKQKFDNVLLEDYKKTQLVANVGVSTNLEFPLEFLE